MQALSSVVAVVASAAQACAKTVDEGEEGVDTGGNSGHRPELPASETVAVVGVPLVPPRADRSCCRSARTAAAGDSDSGASCAAVAATGAPSPPSNAAVSACALCSSLKLRPEPGERKIEAGAGVAAAEVAGFLAGVRRGVPSPSTAPRPGKVEGVRLPGVTVTVCAAGVGEPTRARFRAGEACTGSAVLAELDALTPGNAMLAIRAMAAGISSDKKRTGLNEGSVHQLVVVVGTGGAGAVAGAAACSSACPCPCCTSTGRAAL